MTLRLNHPGGQAQKNFREEGEGEGQGEGGWGEKNAKRPAGGRAAAPGRAGPALPRAALRRRGRLCGRTERLRAPVRACPFLLASPRARPRARVPALSSACVHVARVCPRACARFARHAPAAAPLRSARGERRARAQRPRWAAAPRLAHTARGERESEPAEPRPCAPGALCRPLLPSAQPGSFPQTLLKPGRLCKGK